MAVVIPNLGVSLWLWVGDASLPLRIIGIPQFRADDLGATWHFVVVAIAAVSYFEVPVQALIFSVDVSRQSRSAAKATEWSA